MSDLGFDREELELLLQNVDNLSEAELLEVEKMIEELDKRAKLQAARDDLIAFCQYMDPNYKVGRHHRLLANQLMAIERGEKDRVCVNIPPRHGKSQLVSTYYPAWFIGRNGGKKVMLVSHTSDLAVDFGRKVRNIIDSEPYQQVFSNVGLSSDSKSAGRWNTTTGCEFYATGVGSALAGRGADLLLVDDPHSEQDVLNGNFTAFDKAYDWFAFGARTRLMPGGRVAIVHCMTGETPVLLACGSEKPLRDIRPGDMVASYKDGALVSRKVLNWASQGIDCIYAIHTTCGKVVRANERHPFLVYRDGEQKWIKVRDLRRGDSLVSLKVAPALLAQKQNPENAMRANRLTLGTVSTPTRRDSDQTTGVNTEDRLVQSQAANFPQRLLGCVHRTIIKLSGPLAKDVVLPRETATHTLNTATVSTSPITTVCWQRKMGSARSVGDHRALTTPRQTGKESWLSTTVMVLQRFGRYCATLATLLSVMGRRKKHLSEQFNTSEIISIVPDGEEEVFDIQVEDTENFIANGLVSHNTRWHSMDLTGRLVQDMTNNEGSDQYEVVEYPAILEVEDKDTGEIVQKALWPEFFDLPALLRTKASMPAFQWNAQYQQNPTGEEASIIKRDWWRIWPGDEPPAVEYVIMALDAAAESHNRADFTSLTTWGVFFNEEENAHQIVLLNAIKRRVEFPELKVLATEEYNTWNPDSFIVEKKSSGTPLYQEMRRAGLMVQEYTPVRGTTNNPNSKMARLNSISDIISSGLVWVPATRWAEELIEEVAGFPFAPNDDHCFVSGTRVMMFDGTEKPIEQVVIGDLVATPAGPKPVRAAGYTGMRVTHTLAVSGVVLEGTGNHPVATTTGWKRLDTITMADTIKMTNKGVSSWLGQRKTVLSLNRFISTVINITAIQRLKSGILDYIFGAPVEGDLACIAQFGNTPTGQSLTGITSTTKMETVTTTTLQTLNASHRKNTLLNTQCLERYITQAKRNWSTSEESEIEQALGISLKKVGHGIEKSQQRLSGPEGQHMRLESALRPSAQKTPVRGFVKSVVRSFIRRLVRLNYAEMRAPVEHISVGSVRKPVYNLSVDGAHCFYANGVLVHNCDTTIMALMRFRQGGFIRLPTDEPDPEPVYRRRAAYY